MDPLGHTLIQVGHHQNLESLHTHLYRQRIQPHKGSGLTRRQRGAERPIHTMSRESSHGVQVK